MRSDWLANPLAIDCGIQAVILWSLETFGLAGLPSFVGRYRQFRKRFPQGGLRVLVEATREGEHRVTAKVVYVDAATDEPVARMDDCHCIIDGSLQDAYQNNRLAVQSRHETHAG